MANRPAQETSPYLLEHANNPVDWYPWGTQALAKARSENKPILLSIGYSACHWCHVMARESFEDAEIAALMNRDFISIKVDREERPDLDQVYMRAVQGLTGSGGWPMTVFLLPDGAPFFAGTYFPPSDRFGMPSFRRVLGAVAEAFAQRPAEVEATAAQVRDFLERPVVPLAAGSLTAGLLDEAYARRRRDHDAVHGGLDGAPKFPQPMAIEFLLRTSVRSGDPAAQATARQTLRAMAEGGMYDQLAGGFHRYSVDEHWLVPHFEKMLYDNALLARAYLDAWQLTREPLFRRVAEETLAFVMREMTASDGGFFSSLDADSDGEEGRFYLWTAEELKAALGVDEAAALAAAFDVTDVGNFEGRSILHPVTADAASVMAAARQRLMAYRDGRTRPQRDEKVIASWNGLMLRAFADAGRVLDRPDLVSVAEANAGFLLSRMRDRGRMRRSYKDGRATVSGYLEDQVAVADGLLSLYAASFDVRWLDEARGLLDEMLVAFWDDGQAAFFDTAVDHERLVVRPQDVTDNATPSGTSMAVDVLLRAGALLGQDSWLATARQTLEVVRSRFLPNLLVAVATADGNPSGLPLLTDRPAVDASATAYLCEGFVCRLPTTDPAALDRQLDRVLSHVA